ncbi:hypothetical protein ACJZ2D_012407 [Fusarium nematophilum]
MLGWFGEARCILDGFLMVNVDAIPAPVRPCEATAGEASAHLYLSEHAVKGLILAGKDMSKTWLQPWKQQHDTKWERTASQPQLTSGRQGALEGRPQWIPSAAPIASLNQEAICHVLRQWREARVRLGGPGPIFDAVTGLEGIKILGFLEDWRR